METPATLSVVASFTLILDGLMAAIAARIADYPFTAEMVVFLWKRVNRVKNRFVALAALIQAGKIPRERAKKPRAGKRPESMNPVGINWKKWLPMGTFAWLCWLMQSKADRFGAAQFGEGLRQLLGRAEMRAILAATPKAGRMLAPLCFMLGIEASLLRPTGEAPRQPAPVPERVMCENVASGTMESRSRAAPIDNSGEPLPVREARPRVPEELAASSTAFFVPT